MFTRGETTATETKSLKWKVPGTDANHNNKKEIRNTSIQRIFELLNLLKKRFKIKPKSVYSK